MCFSRFFWLFSGEWMVGRVWRRVKELVIQLFRQEMMVTQMRLAAIEKERNVMAFVYILG